MIQNQQLNHFANLKAHGANTMIWMDINCLPQTQQRKFFILTSLFEHKRQKKGILDIYQFLISYFLTFNCQKIIVL